MAYLASVNEGTKLAIGYGAVMFTFCTLLLPLFPRETPHGKLHCHRRIYRGPNGTFEKTTRLSRSATSAMSHIASISFRHCCCFRHKGYCDERRPVVLENVSEGKRKREIIWELVLAKSPGLHDKVTINSLRDRYAGLPTCQVKRRVPFMQRT